MGVDGKGSCPGFPLGQAVGSQKEEWDTSENRVPELDSVCVCVCIGGSVLEKMMKWRE